MSELVRGAAGVQVRAIHGRPPVAGALAMTPRLEDAYLDAMTRSRSEGGR